MRENRCAEFQDWLERLPRKKLSPKFESHLNECKKCRRIYQQLDPVVTALNSLKDPNQLSSEKLSKISAQVRAVNQKKTSHLMAVKVSLASLITLPLLVVINWAMASAGYGFLSNISTGFARFFLFSFILTAVVVSGVVYASIPLLIGWFHSRRTREPSA